ncbi:MAG: hypothetical protein ACK5AY_13730 [Bacteroidota bacterium]|jgi:hypothetical protein
MKNKLKLSMSAMLLFASFLNSQTEKKMAASLGVTLHPEVGVGHDLQFSYALKNKLTVGFQSISVFEFPDNRTSVYRTQPPVVREFNVNDSWKSTYLAFNINARYYFSGNCTPESNFSFYGGLGIGIVNQKYANTFVADLATTDTLYFKNVFSGNELVLMPNIVLGVDKKLGPGKIYLDLNFMYGIYNWSSFEDQFDSRYGKTSNSGKYSGSEVDAQIFFPINVGYRINF